MAPKPYTTSEFIAKAKALWGDRWDYSKTEYTRSRDKITVTCKVHGDFNQEAASLLKGWLGCPGCASESNRARNLKTTEMFITEAARVWGDRWDYSPTEYKGAKQLLEVRCREHGPYKQKASNHLEGLIGCRSCRGYKPLETTESFITKALEVWGSRWDYSKVDYTNSKTHVTIICPSHGEFLQIPGRHLQKGVGCPGCHGQLVDTGSFRERAVEVWGNRWDYSLVEYTNTHTPVRINCPDHGLFQQSPLGHLAGNIGCISCRNQGTSLKEKELLNYIGSLGLECIHRYRLGSGKELDIFIPSKGVAIEFNGLFWHSDKFKDKNYHYNKYMEASKEGINLLQIWEDSWDTDRDKVQRHINHVLGMSVLKSLHARDSRVAILTSSEAREFLDQYHLQGFVSSSVYLGLTIGDSLVAVAAFKKDKTNYILSRYATSQIVRGGHSKLIAFFERNYIYEQLVTFADLTCSQGNLYRTTGWMEDGVLPPDYSYIVDGGRVHKFNYRIKRFKEDPTLIYVEGLSETELAKLNGILRVWDAGKIRFVKSHPS